MSTADSPAPSESEPKKTEVNFQFCQECSNLLYPKEDRATAELLYVCKACHAITKAESACTWQLNLGSNVQETAGVTTDVANDPTVRGSSSPCCPEEMPCFCTMCGDQLRCTECGDPRSEDLDNSDLSDFERLDLSRSLPREKKVCPRCRENEAVSFQSQQRAADTGMKLYYVCVTCNYTFN